MKKQGTWRREKARCVTLGNSSSSYADDTIDRFGFQFRVGYLFQFGEHHCGDLLRRESFPFVEIVDLEQAGPGEVVLRVSRALTSMFTKPFGPSVIA